MDFRLVMTPDGRGLVLVLAARTTFFGRLHRRRQIVAFDKLM